MPLLGFGQPAPHVEEPAAVVAPLAACRVTDPCKLVIGLALEDGTRREKPARRDGDVPHGARGRLAGRRAGHLAAESFSGRPAGQHLNSFIAGVHRQYHGQPAGAEPCEIRLHRLY